MNCHLHFHIKKPKQTCHALLLLALQSHHSDREYFGLFFLLFMVIYLQTLPLVKEQLG